ncbi:hypothetical protein [Acidovorax sp. SUPP3334]|uniref:hypothetical protein n=1 Tax=Acidovorax sp. SUPP3334 TaxID=2920881 RepID=UPI0023DE5047|nr:hypothetical protein [Acidovorax sp. SUPP3334]GKT26507.1 hypothetical protein AVHM3334_21210 [Acidovorax sp. SUPP3334]
MRRVESEWRPLPEQILVMAFPQAYLQGAPAPISTLGESGFFCVQAMVQHIDVDAPDVDWLWLAPPEPLTAGSSKIGYRAMDNTLSLRSAFVAVSVRGKRYEVQFVQQPGELVQTQMVRLLNSPLTIDCLMAVSFIASLIKKIPIPPIKVIVAVIAVVALLALGMAVSLLRRSFILVPEPLPLSTDTNGVPITIVPGVSVSNVLPLENVLAENQTIALQTVKAVYWLIKEVK